MHSPNVACMCACKCHSTGLLFPTGFRCFEACYVLISNTSCPFILESALLLDMALIKFSRPLNMRLSETTFIMEIIQYTVPRVGGGEHSPTGRVDLPRYYYCITRFSPGKSTIAMMRETTIMWLFNVTLSRKTSQTHADTQHIERLSRTRTVTKLIDDLWKSLCKWISILRPACAKHNATISNRNVLPGLIATHTKTRGNTDLKNE